tara:strand:+ start:2244 stop:3884 length:1641 start_codon:yes stop_codon:yes gene_type:complete
MNNQINIPITVDAKDLPYELDKAVSVVERATKGMSKSLAESVKQSGFQYKSLQEAYSTTVRHAELLAVTLGEDSAAYKDAVLQAQNYAAKMQGVQSAIHNSTTTIGKGTGQLNMAMAQLTREAPAFTYSMTTGFMAISNNIPILVDEINRLKIANQGLAASGQSTKSVFSAVVGALFSWQTALSVGITVLTVFGARIADSISSNDEYIRSIGFLEASTTKLTNSVIDETGELYKKNEQLRISLAMLQNGTIKDEESIKINNEKIAQAKKLLYENDLYNSTQLANLEAGQKAVMLTKFEVIATNNKIKSLTDLNAILRANIVLEKEIKRLQELDIAVRKDQKPIITIETKDSMKEAKLAVQSMIDSDIQKGWNRLLEKTKMNTVALEDFVKMTDYTEARMKVVTQTLTTSFNAVGVAIGDAFATGDFDGSILKFLADFMAIVGSAAIALGVAYKSTGLLAGQGAIAVGAGIALIAASRVVGSKAGGGGGGGGGSKITSSNVNSQGFQGGAYQFAPTSSYLDVTGLIRGQDIVISTSNTNRNNKRVKR